LERLTKWLKTLTGVLTSLAALVTAGIALWALVQNSLIGHHGSPGGTSNRQGNGAQAVAPSQANPKANSDTKDPCADPNPDNRPFGCLPK
jgi:hypothetical protein